MECARFEVQGRVQGVGYRMFVWRAAQKLQVRGWVKNRPDHAVEVTAAGTAAALTQLEIQLRLGPPGAWVEQVVRTAAPPTPPLLDAHTRFDIVED